MGYFIIDVLVNGNIEYGVITQRLSEIGLDWSNIIGVICDGAAVNTKFIREVAKSYGIEFQLCISHGTHLSVLDVLYQKKRNQFNSVEAERTFSDAGNICSLKRTRLSDNSLHSLVFLKNWFKLKKEKGW